MARGEVSALSLTLSYTFFLLFQSIPFHYQHKQIFTYICRAIFILFALAALSAVWDFRAENGSGACAFHFTFFTYDLKNTFEFYHFIYTIFFLHHFTFLYFLSVLVINFFFFILNRIFIARRRVDEEKYLKIAIAITSAQFFCIPSTSN